MLGLSPDVRSIATDAAVQAPVNIWCALGQSCADSCIKKRLEHSMSTLTLLLAAVLASVAATGMLQVLLIYVEPSSLEALTGKWLCLQDPRQLL